MYTYGPNIYVGTYFTRFFNFSYSEQLKWVKHVTYAACTRFFDDPYTIGHDGENNRLNDNHTRGTQEKNDKRETQYFTVIEIHRNCVHAPPIEFVSCERAGTRHKKILKRHREIGRRR